MLRAPAPLASFALLAACASGPTVYPSLAPRPVEKLGFAEPATPPPAPAAQDPVLDSKLAAITAKGATAARDFDRAVARAETLARTAKGAKVGSDAWIAAQTAIADLDALRSSYGDSVGALDDLASTRAAALQPAYPALEQALAAARATAQAQTARIDALAGSLPGA
ncbi:MAG: hypothetical protein PGN16_01035 [Sphingomonas phyllosphaerae]|uniref:hypothetical protein n=1 Tax=Sphingomonas phyllosphaerae TaxID=257003 RepID=UPI002FF9D475